MDLNTIVLIITCLIIIYYLIKIDKDSFMNQYYNTSDNKSNDYVPTKHLNLNIDDISKAELDNIQNTKNINIALRLTDPASTIAQQVAPSVISSTKKLINSGSIKALTNISKSGTAVLAKIGSIPTVSFLSRIGSNISTRLGLASAFGPAAPLVFVGQLAFSLLSSTLDIFDTGGYSKLSTIEQQLKIKKREDDAIKQLYKENNIKNPIVIGPLDKLSDKELDDKIQNLLTNNSQSKIFESLCKSYQGVLVNDIQCSYPDKESCEKSHSWPLKEGEYYSEYKDGACLLSSPTIRTICDSNNLEYDFDEGICKINEEYCKKKGTDWGYNEDIHRNDCIINKKQQLSEYALGTTVTRGIKQIADKDQYKPCNKDEIEVDDYFCKKLECNKDEEPDNTLLSPVANTILNSIIVASPALGPLSLGAGLTAGAVKLAGDLSPMCYPKCKTGYHPVGCCICSPDCPQGWVDEGITCKKTECDDNDEFIGSLCYSKCKDGYNDIGLTCWQNCPDGWTNNGDTCKKDNEIMKKDSYTRTGKNKSVQYKNISDIYGRGVGRIGKVNIRPKERSVSFSTKTN